MFKKIIKIISQHKIIMGIIMVILIGGSYFGYNRFKGTANEVRYVLASVEKGTIITSVTGSGQVSATNQLDIKPKVSGDIVNLYIKDGQEVKSGTLLAQLDSKEAQKAVRDASANLESAKISLEKLKQPADQLSILQAENSLSQGKDNLTKLKLSQQTDYQNALESKQNAQDDLNKAYEDGFNTVSNAFLSLPSILTGLNEILFKYSFNQNQLNIDWYANQTQNLDARTSQYKNQVASSYDLAKQKYNENFTSYKLANRNSEESTIEALILETYETTKIIAETIKTLDNYIDFVQNLMEQYNYTVPALVSTHQSSLSTYTGTTNNHLLNLLSIKRTIENSKEAIISADRDIEAMEQNHPLAIAAQEQTIKEKEGSLAKLKAGADALDLQSQELTIKQRQNSLRDVQEKLADYFIRAPFDGQVTNVELKKGDAVSSASVIATLITKQKIAEITLNEVDIAKAKVGQKATLTFDAVDGLSITGNVIEIDTLGTVTQGVVTYGVKIAFDTQDERVKPGMSVSVAIITAAKQDVLLAPNSAIKSSGNTSYVEMLNQTISIESASNLSGVVSQTPPRQQAVEIGLANDSMTEILKGLNQGDQVITQTTQQNSQQTQTQQQSGSFRMPSIGGGFGR